ncbi:MAG: hypothetical protein IJ368_07615, partial [Oscillospiraceae bacterium]|nr:hypothetical protein [Oscillospiraceae bacterium]
MSPQPLRWCLPAVLFIRGSVTAVCPRRLCRHTLFGGVSPQPLRWCLPAVLFIRGSVTAVCPRRLCRHTLFGGV